MSLEYNAMLRRVHGRSGLRAVDIPARTLGIGPYVRQDSVGAIRPVATARAVPEYLGGSQSSYEGMPGRGSLTPSTKSLQSGDDYLGPEGVIPWS
jgi:hypothetical protein